MLSLSDVLISISTIPDTVCPDAGYIMVAVGGMISGSVKLFTNTDIGVSGVSFPTESITIALIICSISSTADSVSQK